VLLRRPHYGRQLSATEVKTRKEYFSATSQK
jgi:hypothetical protein